MRASPVFLIIPLLAACGPGFIDDTAPDGPIEFSDYAAELGSDIHDFNPCGGKKPAEARTEFDAGVTVAASTQGGLATGQRARVNKNGRC